MPQPNEASHALVQRLSCAGVFTRASASFGEIVSIAPGGAVDVGEPGVGPEADACLALVHGAHDWAQIQKLLARVDRDWSTPERHAQVLRVSQNSLSRDFELQRCKIDLPDRTMK